jgi:putative membrane protein
MQRIIRYGSTLALGTALVLAGACKKADHATTDSAGGTVDSAAAATAPVAPTDSAPVGAPSGAPTMVPAPNALSLIGLTNGGEIAASKIAREKATGADVRAFAKQMVADHEAMQQEADDVASKDNITPQPPAQADQKRAASDQLIQQLNSTAKGTGFDRAYVDAQVQAHQQALADLQQLQTSVDNADVKALIEKAIPKVQDHLARAQQLQSTLK